MQYLAKARVAPVLGEFVGTTTFVMVALVLTGQTRVSYFIATSLAITLAVIYMMFAGVSGAHVNPAITLGMWATRRIRSLTALSYIVAQVVGGFAALGIYQYLVGQNLPAKNASGGTVVWVAEALGTMILAMGFSAAVSRGYDALQSALTYGASLFAGITVATLAASGYLNPAVAIGAHDWNWLYLVAPLIGGVVGMGLYTYLFTATPFPRLGMARPAGRAKTARARR